MTSTYPAVKNYMGLTLAQAEQSRKAHGNNALAKVKKTSFLQRYMHSFSDPMVKILLVALGINVMFLFRTMEWFEPLGIALSIFIATLISATSEHGSQAAFEKIQQDAAKIKVKLIRAGSIVLLPIEDIVVGDLIMLQAGDIVPADGIILSGSAECNQSALNGETREAKKVAAPAESTLLGDLSDEHSVFRGSVIYSGECIMRADSVGSSTFYGKMAVELQSDTRESPMKLRLMQLASTISKIGYTGAALVAVSYVFNILLTDFGFNLRAFLGHYNSFDIIAPELLNIVMLSVTVVVVAVPEGLPMMITVVLSANMNRMLKNGVLVRKMLGIETAGSMNILFTDKTGTLTKGVLSVSEVITGDGKSYKSVPELKTAQALWQPFYLSCYINNGAFISYEGTERRVAGGNSTDRALLSFVKDQPPPKDIPVFCKLPFDSQNKFSAAGTGGKNPMTMFKGAPEKLLPLCTHYMDKNGKKQVLTDKSIIYNKHAALSAASARLLVMAIYDGRDCQTLPEELTYLCSVSIKDELRPESLHSVRELGQAGIQVVMVTGDSLDTACAIARECGIVSRRDDWVTESRALSRLSDADIIKRLKHLKVVARALPSDKSRLVKLAQQAGLVCGMTGDGVNDGPALKAADVGFSMGSGSEVAKEASDIVILDDNINSITRAVLYGRTIFKSIRKFVIYQLTVNLCAVGLSVIAPFLGTETPITIVQMLWINMVMDTLGGLAFSGEPTRDAYMYEKPKAREERILNKYMISQILWTGGYTLILCLAFIKLPFMRGFLRKGDPILYTAIFALFMYAAVFNSLSARTHNINLTSYIARNKPFILIMSLVLIIQTLMIYLGGNVFRTVGLTPRELAAVLLTALTVLPADILRKLILKKKGILRGV